VPAWPARADRRQRCRFEALARQHQASEAEFTPRKKDRASTLSSVVCRFVSPVRIRGALFQRCETASTGTGTVPTPAAPDIRTRAAYMVPLSLCTQHGPGSLPLPLEMKSRSTTSRASLRSMVLVAEIGNLLAGSRRATGRCRMPPNSAIAISRVDLSWVEETGCVRPANR